MNASRLLGIPALLLLLSGCDAVYDKVNENLPQIGVANGVLGLNGEAGAEMTGGFAAVAGKSGQASTVASFTLDSDFADYGATNFKVREIDTQVGIAISNGVGLTVTRPGTSLPATIMMQGFSLNGSIADSQNTFTLPGLNVPDVGMEGGNFGFRRASCETTSTTITCGYNFCTFLDSGPDCYGFNGGVSGVLAGRIRILSMGGGGSSAQAEQESTERLLKVVTEQGGAPTRNRAQLTFRFATPVSAAELAGATATMRLAEIGTQLKADLL